MTPGRINRLVATPLLLAALVALPACGIFRSGNSGPKTPVVGERVPVLTSDNSAEVDPTLASVAVSVPAPVQNNSWTQSGGNAAKSMGHLALGATPTQVWTATIAGTSNRARLAASPVVANGRVYVIDSEARIHAFDAATGATVWTTVLGADGNTRSLFGGGVSVEGDRLYATNGVGDAAALNIADGSVIWKVRPGGPLRGAPTLSNGNAYVITQDNQLFALSQADGSVVWTEAGTIGVAGVFGVAAPAAAQGSVVAGFSSGDLNAYRYENGRVLWQDELARTGISSTAVATLSDINADPVIDQGRVYAIGAGGRMVALELTTGQRLWELNVGGISTPWIAGEWLFVVTDEGKLLCVARSTGRIRWLTQLRRYRDDRQSRGPVSWTGPVLAGGRLILASSEGQIVYADPVTGAVQATQEHRVPIQLSPVVADNTLYLLDSDGRLSAWR
ncbi:outer membrane protein assembly factor BamB [Sphingomonas jejuensis]|uniref:Outer membrane protein assembly factor BamB n=1 Tax=Sphingomonas jejuensis TaxID=904715 RepID=A0ABX0XII2_9SPHN|nr:PQQ-binding-like beta-propeller repeat protein [Sphingomonas jejuensis]NJC32626.1 outer membrane protein assembly factor BamB [Sphingomonas jejuensis]